MRLAGRFISREAVLAAVETYQLVEAYPDDKYLPSYLVLARHEPKPFTCCSRRTLKAIMSGWSRRTCRIRASGRVT